MRGRGYAPRGRTPEVRVDHRRADHRRADHRRADPGPIPAVANRGEPRWMVLDGAVKAPSLLRFLARLVRDAGRKVSPIPDRLPVHRSAKVRAWLAGREAGIEAFHLPGYSPEPSERCSGAGRGGQRRPEAGGHPRGAGARAARRSSGAPSSGTCASWRSCPTGCAASSDTGPSATPPSSRPPRPDQ